MALTRYESLIETVRRLQPGVIVEVGTWNGYTARNMLRASPRSVYYGFDLFEEATDETDTREFTKKASTRRKLVASLLAPFDATLIQGDTRRTLPEWASSFPGKVDFAWVDGGHSLQTIESDWTALKGVLSPHAVVMFDDFFSDGPDTSRFGCNTLMKSLPHDLLPGKDRVKSGGFTQIAVVKATDL